MSSSPPVPLANSYWVLPGQLLAGEYPGAHSLDSSRERIGRLLAAGIDCFVDLTAPDELPPYGDLLPASVPYHRRPIRDHDVPALPEHMQDILELIERALRAGRHVYVHCRAGIGRTGTVLGCFLAERGASGDAALETLNRAWQQSARATDWPSVPETDGQVEYVRQWLPRGSLDRMSAAAEGPAALRQRFVGALLGLATGDALATATQQREPGTFDPVAEMTGGGPFELPPGAWTDDTAMSLCLAESLLVSGGFDARDQVERYTRWLREGYLSATGECVGVRAGVARALAVAQWRRQVFPGSHEPSHQDPEPLSRVAPVVMFTFPSLDEAVRSAGDAARITCQAPLTVEVCRTFAAMLHAALSGRTKEEILAPPEVSGLPGTGVVRPRIRSLLRGRYRHKERGQIRTGSTSVEALEAALWSFDRSVTFEEGALLAANLGENSDVVTAAYGQLAGAHYTAAAIPRHWRREIRHLALIEGLAEELYRVCEANRPLLR
ncbi:MAG TPA: ADP-ribosylglycohydrolase family protein [Steroidobacteraceae bacterium]|nr:ADP-ribosylglycohydrolase family protein [Steroidobacteraceae bacterium]